MPKLIKATDSLNITNLKVLIYGQPGIGKTSLGNSSDSPLLLDFDNGKHRAVNRANSVTIESWQDALDLLDFNTLDDETITVLSQTKTVIVDTVSKLQDYLSAYIIASDSKMGRNGSLTLQGYGALKSKFKEWVARLMLLQKDIVFICQDKEEKDGDNIKIRPDITGGGYNAILAEMDLVGYYHINNNKRTLDFNLTNGYIGKNLAGFDPIVNPRMQNVLADAKNSIIEANEQQNAVLEIINSYRVKIDQAKTVEEANELVAEIKTIEEPIVRNQVKAYFAPKIKELNLVFNPEVGLYESKKA